MLNQPATKYTAFPPIALHDRQWPSQQITKPPVWLSTDLRDGNQALFEPMSVETKIRFFTRLVEIGFKEVEVGFPSASQTDFNFVRRLIDENRIPADVTPMVITQAREDLIARTVESVRGAKRAIVHLYNATAPVWRKVVFNMEVPQVMQLIKDRVAYLKKLTDAAPETEWVLQYSPETFSATELEVSLQACNTAIEAWNADSNRPVIINLPTTVENATPNVFADQIEWMHRRLIRREHVVLSVHPHNDRGTGVAAAELAQMAGAQRVEGCLLGNGERCGNVDIVTLAMNLYTQGVHPGLDFSDINTVAREVEEFTQIATHPRHPYAGDLVFTAFSGSHQDAIKKGFAAQKADAIWEVPYLPIDPADLGRTYDSVIRVNSQSGKGGVAYLLEKDHGVVLPRRMQVEFSAVVQRHAEAADAEVSSEEIWKLFKDTYLRAEHTALTYISHHLQEGPNDQQVIDLNWRWKGDTQTRKATGSGPVEAACKALGVDMQVLSFEERSMGTGADALAIAIVEGSTSAIQGSRFGVGIHRNTTTASVMALISLARRLEVTLPEPADAKND